MYARESPDLVTLDLLMPEMEGPEVLSRLKEVDPAVNVVICSSNVQADARQDVMDRGAVAFLNKPVRPDDLKPVLEENKYSRMPGMQHSILIWGWGWGD